MIHTAKRRDQPIDIAPPSIAFPNRWICSVRLTVGALIDAREFMLSVERRTIQVKLQESLTGRGLGHAVPLLAEPSHNGSAVIVGPIGVEQ